MSVARGPLPCLSEDVECCHDERLGEQLLLGTVTELRLSQGGSSGYSIACGGGLGAGLTVIKKLSRELLGSCHSY